MIIVGFLCVMGAIVLLGVGLAQSDSNLVWASIAASGLGGVAVVVAGIQRGRAVGRAETAAEGSGGPSKIVDVPSGPVVFSSPPNRSWAANGGADDLPAHAGAVSAQAGPHTDTDDDDDGRPDELLNDDELPNGDELPNDDAVYGDGVVDDVIITDTTDETTVAEAVEAISGSETDPTVDPVDEPAEEDVEIADVLTVVDLDVAVLVVDLRPRYHLEGCEHLRTRETIPIPVHQAREDGFTPCGLCRPDAALASAARTTNSSDS